MSANVRNASDEEQVKKAGKKQKDAVKEHEKDLKDLLKLKAGRRFFWRYLSICGIFNSSLAETAELTAFNEGMRNVGLQLLEPASH